jgi:MOSC domain-containing protein YiiM
LTGEVLAIELGRPADGARQPVAEARAVPGQGLEGDKNFAPEPAKRPGADLTLIAQEALDALHQEWDIEFSHTESGRNVLTRGIDVNGLLGKRFRVGEVECRGIELCEPCNHLEKTRNKPGVMRGLVHQAGLNADILSPGTIRVGDSVEALEEQS